MTEQKNSSYLSEKFYARNDELSFIDLFYQLWQGRLTVAITSFLTIVLSAALLLMMSPKWTSQAIVTYPTLGQLSTYTSALNVLFANNGNDKPAVLDVQKNVFYRFSSSASSLSAELKNEIPSEKLIVEQFSPGKDDTLKISYVGSSPEVVQEKLEAYLKKLNSDLVAHLQTDIENSFATKELELQESLDSQFKISEMQKSNRISALKQALKVAQSSNLEQSQLTQADNLSDDALYLFGSKSLSSMIENEASKPLQFSDYYYQTEQSLLLLKATKLKLNGLNSFSMISKPNKPNQKTSPDSILVLIAGLFVGFVLGCLIVILRTVIREYRSKV